MSDEEKRSADEDSDDDTPLPPPKPKIDYSKNPEQDPEVQEMLKSGWVVAPKKPPRVETKNNVPSIFSNKPDVSYLWKNQGPEEQPPDVPQEQQIHVDLSKFKISGSYEIGPDIGRGTASLVKKGKSKTSPNNEVAIKVVSQSIAPFITAPQRKQQIAILQEISADKTNVNLVKLIQSFEESDQIHLVLEKMAGEVFKLACKAPGDWTEKDACHVVKHVLEGLSFLHSKNIFHGDIQPDNVLSTSDKIQEVLSKPGMIKLGGFCFSRKIIPNQPGTVTDMFCAEEFKAPESLMRQPVSLPADMWCLGCLSYFSLSGHPPFTDRNTAKLQMSIRKAQYQQPDQEWKVVSNEAKDFIKKLLVADPKARLTAQQALNHPWIKGGKPTPLPLWKKNAPKFLH